jgi:acyl-CoA synthetase (AMP-forming)/AMP-acid ligase II
MMHGWIEAHADHTPEAPALRFLGQRIAYAGLRRRIHAAGAMLAARGIGRGDRIAFLGTNHPSQIVLLFAAAGLGAAQVPLNWRLAPPELRHALEDSGAGMLFATEDMLARAEEVAPPGCAVLAAEAERPEAEATFRRAVEAYRRIAAEYPKDFNAPLALIAQAQLLRYSGKIDDARRVCETVMTQYRDSYASADATRLLRVLKPATPPAAPAASPSSVATAPAAAPDAAASVPPAQTSPAASTAPTP